MKILKTYIYSHKAHLDLAKLKDEGIETWLMDDNIVSIDPLLAHAVGGIKLFVDEDDYEKADRILKENNFQDLVDEFSADYIGRQSRCPMCGSIKIFQKRSWLSGIFFLLVFRVPFSLPKSSYYCLDCSHQWKEQINLWAG